MNSPDTSPAGGEAAPSPGTKTAASGDAWSDRVKTIGGLVAVAVGVVAVLVIAIVALHKGSDTAATIASSASGVIATVVGAYFGVKVGTDQTRTALEGQQAEAAKAQVYAAHVPEDKAKDVVDMAESIANKLKS